jgi:hypothetical protein
MEELKLDPPVAIESIPAPPIPEVVEPPNNNARDFGILIGVIVLAAVCAKLYAVTAKK